MLNLKIFKWKGWDKVLMALWVLALTLPNAILSITEPYGILAKLANLLLPMGLYGLLVTLAARVRWTAVFIFPLAFFAAFQLVLLYLYGNSIIAVDMLLNVVTTNPDEAGELLASIWPSVVIVVVVYVPLMVWGIWALCRHEALPPAYLRRRAKSWGGVALLGLCLTIGAYASVPGYTVREQMYPINVGYNVCLAVERQERANARIETIKDFTFNAKSERDSGLREAHVMVIGETSRAANFGIYGYERSTTPRMESLDGIVAFSHALSQSNTTHKSVPMLLTGVGADNFDDVYRQKGLITAYKEAGYHTVFLSNQKFNHSLIDELAFEADECVFINEEGDSVPHHFDQDLLPLIGMYLADSHPKLLIVCHTYGSHFDYYDRYPRSGARFVPDRHATATASQRPTLVNEYDNTILGVDAFLASVADSLMAHRPVASMLYSSDHGEDIFDDSRGRFLHASPTPTFHQLHVPFIVWTSDSLDLIEPNLHANLLNNKDKDIETSVSAFYTMLSLGGISIPGGDVGRSAAASELARPRRKYLNDHNQAVPLLVALPDTADKSLISKFNIN